MPKADQLGVSDVEHVLTGLYGLEGRKRGDEYDILCPNPAHQERDPSCSVNLDTGLFKCLACGIAGDLIILGTYVLNEEYEYCKQLLRPSTAEALAATVQRKLSAAVARPRAPRAVELPGPYEDGPLDEMVERGFTEATLRRYGVRYCTQQSLNGKKGEFIIHHSIAIPIRDSMGQLLAWSYRRTAASPVWQPRYLYTPDVSLSELWFGMDHYSDADDIVIVEGAADSMWVSQCGLPSLALLGSEMGDRKLRHLCTYRTVTIFGDYDTAGIAVVQRIGTEVGSRVAVRVARYPRWVKAWVAEQKAAGRRKAKIDPQNLPPVDVELSVATAIPWTRFLLDAKAGAKAS